MRRRIALSLELRSAVSPRFVKSSMKSRVSSPLKIAFITCAVVVIVAFAAAWYWLHNPDRYLPMAISKRKIEPACKSLSSMWTYDISLCECGCTGSR